MSQQIFRVIPTDPFLLPTPDVQRQARELFLSLLPRADVQIVANEEVEFIDAGENFDEILCPLCQKVVSPDWWGEAMDQSYTHSHFQNLTVIMPCCQDSSSLNDLDYAWPVGFARFVLETASEDCDLTDQQLSLFEPVLGCPVRKIQAHY